MIARRVLGVLAGRDVDPDRLRAWVDSADRVVAADGAADLLAEAGRRAHLVLGDFDSIGEAGLRSAQEALRDPDQETSDCDKLLARLVHEGHPEATLIGVEGDRLDHVLGTLASVARSPVRVRMVFRTGFGWIVRPGDPLVLELEPGTRFSALPLTLSRGVVISGARWELDGAELDALGLVSLSNEATGRLTVDLRSGALFVAVAGDPAPDWPASEP